MPRRTDPGSTASCFCRAGDPHRAGPGASFVLDVRHCVAADVCRRRVQRRVDESARLHRAGPHEGRGLEALEHRARSPSILQRGGWKFNSVKKGDKVTAIVSPLRNGDPGAC